MSDDVLPVFAVSLLVVLWCVAMDKTKSIK